MLELLGVIFYIPAMAFGMLLALKLGIYVGDIR